MVTLADVARRAGVSASTASRALNGRGELSEQTRAAVAEAAKALQFEPSQLARSLRTSTTHTVGFVVPDVSSPFYAAALKGAQAGLEQAGYRVMLMDSGQERDGELAALRTLLNHQVDGLLLSTDRLEEIVGWDEILDRLEQLDARQARIVELRFFGGLNVEEVAEIMEVSTTTVKREWASAKAWLHRQIKNNNRDG